MTDWISNYLEGYGAENVLAVGGNVESSKYWASLYPDSKFTVLNIDENELPEQTDKLTPLTCDAQEMTLPDSSFDLVVSNQVLEHIYAPDKCLKEVFRVLKPDGKAVFTTPNLAAWYNRIGLLFGYQPFNYTPSPGYRNIGFPSFVKKDNIFDHPRVFTHRALKELFQNIGFVVEKTAVVNHTYSGQPYEKLRSIINYLIPMGWRENIIIRVSKP